jgi:hypothetical protein
MNGASKMNVQKTTVFYKDLGLIPAPLLQGEYSLIIFKKFFFVGLVTEEVRFQGKALWQ